MKDMEKNLNSILIIILSGVLLSAFGVQFILREDPCPLCLLQRIGMISVASAAALNLWCGIRMSHYGIALLSAVFGGFVALRQISLHVCPGMPEFGLPVLGLSLYTWSFIVFVCVVLFVALLLLIHNPEGTKNDNQNVNALGKFATFLILGIAVVNLIATLVQCGLSSCEV